ncbi:prenyltransferase/squalene oxidase repeat-containing protein [Streptomyces sp. NPDC057280]|uniref:prenyltransferase/squalene oxidase repeat-containing protein n=1 Tax=Streptomyces sp. NPDC057280 TaxID=3346081 RepID=UPI003640D1D2
MNVRRSAAVLAATAVIGTATPAVAADPSTSPSPSPSVVIPDGLYGTGDPTYDGVWRQSLALMAQNEVSVDPADTAVAWLAGQQCASGAFPAFRADTNKPCDAKVMVDTNMTAVAVQALTTLTESYDTQVKKAVTWLKSVQNKDGGWGYSAGSATDANSTSLVVGALAQAGVTVPNLRKEGKSPLDALWQLSLPCDSKDAGAFAYQPDKKGKLTANADATVAAVLGGYGEVLAAGPQEDADTSVGCRGKQDDGLADVAADNGAAWLAKTLKKDGYLKSALPGSEDQPDYGNTADAVVALASAGYNDQAAASLRWLEANAVKWAEQSGPAAYAQLIFATKAGRGDVHSFGGKDLVTLLNATGPTPRAINAEPPTASAEDVKASDQNDDDGALTVAWTVGGGLLLGSLIGFGLMLRGRKRQQ